MDLEWVDIPGYEDLYKINKSGEIFSTWKQNLKIICYPNPSDNRGVYPCITLHKNGKYKRFLIHRLLAEIFIFNDDPIIKTQVNHINGIKNDFSLENLEWVSASENVKHAFRTGLNIPERGEIRYNAVFTDFEVIEIAKKLEAGITMKEIAAQYNSNIQTISGIKNNGNWKHLTKDFKFKSNKRKIIDNNGIIYDSLTDASKITGAPISKICLVLKGQRNHTKGLKFYYLD